MHHEGALRRPAGESMQLRFHTQVAGSALTAQQVDNVVRVAMQALAAVLGGTQSLHTNGAMRPTGCPPSAPRPWRCAPSRSSPTSRGGRFRGPAGGQLRDGADHRLSGGRRAGPHRGDRQHGRHGRGHRAGLPQRDQARPSSRRERRHRRGQRLPEEEAVEIEVNAELETAQVAAEIDALSGMRVCLERLGARAQGQNLMPAIVEADARCVEEIADTPARPSGSIRRA